MSIVISIVAFLVLLSVLILIHEWGHFAAARKAGVVVEEFGFGLPPMAMTLFKQKGTRFTINWIPFGGFVRLKGENALNTKEHQAPGSFGAASIPARVAILCGGVFMNFLLAVVILTLGFSFWKWVPSYPIEEMEALAARGLVELELGVRIDDVLPDGPAQAAGIPAGAILAAVDDAPITYMSEVFTAQAQRDTVTYTLLVGEARTPQTFTVTLQDSKAGFILSEPLALMGTRRSVLTGLGMALHESWVMMRQTVQGLGHLFASVFLKLHVPEGITGVVGIFKFTHLSVQEGLMAYLRLAAFLNLSLAALNILPIPALDGGRLLFVLAEAISRKPINRKFELITNGVGFVFLISLIVLITYYDIIRLF